VTVFSSLIIYSGNKLHPPYGAYRQGLVFRPFWRRKTSTASSCILR